MFPNRTRPAVPTALPELGTVQSSVPATSGADSWHNSAQAMLARNCTGSALVRVVPLVASNAYTAYAVLNVY
jgi:hypothetical protein